MIGEKGGDISGILFWGGGVILRKMPVGKGCQWVSLVAHRAARLEASFIPSHVSWYRWRWWSGYRQPDGIVLDVIHERWRTDKSLVRWLLMYRRL